MDTALGETDDGQANTPEDDVMAWMGENATSSSEVAKLVMRQVLGSVLVDESKAAATKLCARISRHAKLLKKYNSHSDAAEQTTRQANCLFEVQRYCEAATWPSGLAKMLFYKLYDEDVVFEDAFEFWREDVDNPTPGKMKALVQVNEFLHWLATAQEDGGEEDDED